MNIKVYQPEKGCKTPPAPPRKNLPSGKPLHGVEVRCYEKNEFCKDVGCGWLGTASDGMTPDCKTHCCCKTAKDFHRWLKDNNFAIVKPIKENSPEVENG